MGRGGGEDVHLWCGAETFTEVPGELSRLDKFWIWVNVVCKQDQWSPLFSQPEGRRHSVHATLTRIDLWCQVEAVEFVYFGCVCWVIDVFKCHFFFHIVWVNVNVGNVFKEQHQTLKNHDHSAQPDFMYIYFLTCGTCSIKTLYWINNGLQIKWRKERLHRLYICGSLHVEVILPLLVCINSILDYPSRVPSE